ncbi:MAG: tetratricopeptide repeat protein [Planctomycetota bacterium]
MQLSRFIVATITLACGGALVGCSGANPFASRPVDAFSTTRGFDDPNRQPYGQLAQAFPQQNVVGPGGSRMPAPPPQSNSESGWRASLHNAGGAISNAFAVTPKTIPAPDATSLASQPGDVGGALNYHAAKVYETDGNTAGAMALYQKSLKMSPNDVRAMIGYARLLDREGNFREAERLYHQALDLEPANVVALNDLGMIYARQGMFDSALTALNRAVQLEPTNQRYRNNIAIVLIDAGRPDEAFGHLAVAHGEATAHYNLGYLLTQRKMNGQAVAHLQQALAVNPQMTPARQLLDSLAASALSVQQPAVPQPSHSVMGRPVNASYVPGLPQDRSLRPLPPL